MERFMRLLDELHQKVSLMPSFRWAVVEAVSPLQIRYETEAAPVAGTPDTLVAGLETGDRVWCMRIYRRDIVLGRGKGVALPAAPPALASGDGSIALPGSNTVATTTVILPVGMFSNAPRVVVTPLSALATAEASPMRVTERSTVSFDVQARRAASSSVTLLFNWIAVEGT